MLVLVIDDEEQTRNFITKVLKNERYEIVTRSSSLEGLNYIRSNSAPDVMLIDYQLPGGPNGLALAHQARLLHPGSVIMMMSLYAEKENIVEALQINADDFFLKPIKPDELVSRISKAIVRRHMWFPPQEAIRHTGSLKLNLATHTAEWCGERLTLTVVEFSLLKHLTAKPGGVLNYSELYALSKGQHINPEEARTRLKTHITNLKKKLERDGCPNPIQVVRGLGFKWETTQ